MRNKINQKRKKNSKQIRIQATLYVVAREFVETETKLKKYKKIYFLFWDRKCSTLLTHGPLFPQKENGNPLVSSQIAVQGVSQLNFFFWGCKIWKKKKSPACSFISYIYSASKQRKKEEMTSRTWFWEIGDDPNLSFDAMDTRIFVSATRHYRIYVTDRTLSK